MELYLNHHLECLVILKQVRIIEVKNINYDQNYIRIIVEVTILH